MNQLFSKTYYSQFLQNIIKEISLAFNDRFPANSLRLVGVKYSKKHRHEICIVQLIGKNVFAELTADEILSNPSVLKEFSHADVVKITQIAEKIKNEVKNNSIKIHEILRQGNSEKNIFVLRKAGFKQMRRLSSEEIIQENLLEKMNPNDAYEVGYVDGSKTISDLKKEMQAARKLHKKSKGWRRFFLVK